MRKRVNFVLFVIFMGVIGFMYINPSLTSFDKKTYEGYQEKERLIEQISPLDELSCQTELEYIKKQVTLNRLMFKIREIIF